MAWSLVLVACAVGCFSTPPAPTGWSTRFHREAEWSPDAAAVADVYARCPRVRVRSVERSSARFLKVTVEGDRLDQVERIGALLSDGKLANANPKVREDGSLAFPVACPTCTVIFGVRLPGGLAACTGPGFSLQVEGDQVR